MSSCCVRHAVGTALIALMVALVACGGDGKSDEAKVTSATGSPAAGASAPAPKRGGTLRISPIYAWSDSGVGNPILNKWYSNTWPLFDTLVEFDGTKGALLPSLAKSWQWSPDNKSVTFQLREDVKWHDGRPFSADDVAFTMDAIKDEKTNTPLRARLTIGDQLATWTVLNPASIRFDLSAPYGAFFANLAEVPIIPKHLLAGSADINSASFNKKPVGTGPFKLAEWKQGEFLAMEANKEYFNGAPILDRIIVVLYSEESAAIAAMQKGDLDAVFVEGQGVPQFRTDKRFHVFPDPIQPAMMLAFNQKDPLVQDKAVRQAIAHAIEKKSLADTVSRGLSEPGQFLLNPKGSLGPWARKDTPPDEFNLARAKQLLDNAGWKEGGDGIRVKDGSRLSLSLVTRPDFNDMKEAATILERQLRMVGIEVAVRLLEINAWNQLRQDPNSNPRERSLEVTGWPGSETASAFDPDRYLALHSAAVPPAGRNFNYYKNARVDQLLVQARTLVDAEKRRPLYDDAQKILKEDLAYIPLFYALDAIVTTKLKGIPDDCQKAGYCWQRFAEKLWVE